MVAAMGAYFVFDIVALRVDIWLNPWQDPDGRSFQIVQSLMAIADGGLVGSGIGGGIPTFIPVVHTDFTYAAIVEEWGLLGAVGLMLALLTIILRGLRIAALLHHRPFHAFLAAGLCITLSVQSLIIISGALNLIPLTGVTLPFVSYGGSSLLTSFIMVGLLLALSREASPEHLLMDTAE
jgi:cell division protein FtsW (lipid II flippase)